jgi:hypothetical protein
LIRLSPIPFWRNDIVKELARLLVKTKLCFAGEIGGIICFRVWYFSHLFSKSFVKLSWRFNSSISCLRLRIFDMFVGILIFDIFFYVVLLVGSLIILIWMLLLFTVVLWVGLWCFSTVWWLILIFLSYFFNVWMGIDVLVWAVFYFR